MSPAPVSIEDNVEKQVNMTQKVLPGFRSLFLLAPLRIMEEHIENLNSQYAIANAKLQTSKEELDTLLQCARYLREQRSRLARGLDVSTCKTGPELSQSELDNYLALVKKCKAVEGAVKTLKHECASARAESGYVAAKIRHDIFTQLWPLVFLNNIFGCRTSHYSKGTSSTSQSPTDIENVAERLVEAESTATNVAGVLGAFGAGISYTTLFSSSRGRLDLIAWAFACYILVILHCAVTQVLSPPQHIQVENILRNWRNLRFWTHRILTYVSVALPLIIGYILLVISVALLDPTLTAPTQGSRTAIQVAGYLPVASLGNMIVFLGFLSVVRRHSIF